MDACITRRVGLVGGLPWSGEGRAVPPTSFFIFGSFTREDKKIFHTICHIDPKNKLAKLEDALAPLVVTLCHNLKS